MRTDKHNDWTDAFRESFPEEAQPAAGGWEAVSGRMRRAAARRRVAVAAAALALPIAGGIFFLPTRNDAHYPEVAVVNAPSVIPGTDGSPVISREIPALVADIPEKVIVHKNIVPEYGTPQTIPPVQENTVSECGTPQTGPTEQEKPVSEHIIPEDNSSVTPGEAVDLPDLFSETTDTPARGRRLTIGLAGATTAGGTPTTVTAGSMSPEMSTKASNNFWSNNSMNVLQHEYFHDLPLSFGLTASYSLTDRFSLESGLEYTRLHSRLDDIHTVMHFAGIPVRFNYRFFSTGPVDFYTGAGGEVEKCFKATLGGMKVSEKGLQWSGSVLLGAQVRLTRNARLYLQPDLTYYFTKTALVSYRTENRLALSVHAGLRFDIQ